MPRQRRARKRNNNKGAMGYMDRASKGLFLASKAFTIAKGLKNVINSEKKTYDVEIINSTQGTTGSIVELTGMAQGDDYNGRDGRSILLKSLEVKGVMVRNTSSTSTIIRIILFKDNNADGSNPTALELLTTDSNNSLRNAAPHNMKRFHIYVDKVYMLDAAKSNLAKFDFYKELNHHVKYASSAASTSNEGSLWCYLVSNDGINSPSITLRSRVRYYDN